MTIRARVRVRGKGWGLCPHTHACKAQFSGMRLGDGERDLVKTERVIQKIRVRVRVRLAQDSYLGKHWAYAQACTYITYASYACNPPNHVLWAVVPPCMRRLVLMIRVEFGFGLGLGWVWVRARARVRVRVRVTVTVRVWTETKASV